MPDPPTTSTAAPPYKLKVGFNLPYYNCGFDFGPNPGYYAYQDPYWHYYLGHALDTLKSSGVDVVRWFLFANGFNYGFRPDYSMSYDNYVLTEAWSFAPPNPPDPRIFTHFEAALKIFKEKEMQFIPSLISFEFFWDGKRYSFPPVKAQPDAHDFSEGGRSDIARDPNKRRVFLDTLLEPLLKISEGYRDVIYAWEVMNEPYYVFKGLGMPGGGNVTEREVHDFLQAAIDRINGHKFDSTVGHRFSTDHQKYPTGTKPQFHYYPNLIESPLPTSPIFAPNTTAAFIGEFGSQHPGEYSHGLFDIDQSNPWPALNGSDKDSHSIVQRRLQLLEARKYELALVWPESDVTGDNYIKLSQIKLDQIKKFTSGERI